MNICLPRTARVEVAEANLGRPGGRTEAADAGSPRGARLYGMGGRRAVSAGAERGGSPTYKGVQALRGVAACAVVIYHAGRVWAEGSGLAVPHAVSNGASGVDVFFAISGFVMALSATGSRRPGPGEFLRRRVLRVVPLYWLMTAVAVLKLLLVQAVPRLGSAAEHAPVRVWDVVRSLLFIPYINAAGEVLPILQPGWTLSFEMFFYLLFAFALLAAAGRPLRVLGPMLVVLAGVGWFRTDRWPVPTVLVSPVLLEFLGGVLLGYWARAGIGIGRGAAWVAGLLGTAGAAMLAGVWWGDPPAVRVLAWGVPALFVVAAGVLLEDRVRVPRWMLRVGDASYSLYLSHMLVVMFCAWVARRVVGPRAGGMAGFCAVAVLVSVGAGLLLYRWVELPMTAGLAHWTGWNRGRAPMVSAGEGQG